MAKWSLAVRVLPIAALVVAAKAAVILAGFQLIEPSPLLASVVTANVFLLGFLLAGTLSDYKESERLPGEVASHLESIADECWILGTSTGHPVAARCMEAVSGLAARVSGWFRGDVDTNALLRDVTALDRHFLAFEPHTQANFISRLKSEQGAVRTKLVRMDTIRRTGFVPAAYAIAEVGLGLLLLAMLVSDIGPAVQACFFAGVITFFLSYMILLIKDLDDPFEHATGRSARWGAADDEVSDAAVRAAALRIDELLLELQAAQDAATPAASRAA